DLAIVDRSLQLFMQERRCEGVRGACLPELAPQRVESLDRQRPLAFDDRDDRFLELERVGRTRIGQGRPFPMRVRNRHGSEVGRQVATRDTNDGSTSYRLGPVQSIRWTFRSGRLSRVARASRWPAR